MNKGKCMGMGSSTTEETQGAHVSRIRNGCAGLGLWSGLGVHVTKRDTSKWEEQCQATSRLIANQQPA